MDNNIQQQITSEASAPSKGMKIFKELGNWALCIVVAIVVALILRTYVFTVVKVVGESMCPTLENHQRLFTRIIGYEPKRGDIIIFNPKSSPNEAYVKRVIATEGDRIWIDDATGEVHLKKKGSDEWVILKEDYIADEPYNSNMPNIAQKIVDDSGDYGLLIKKDHIFVLGDNRNHSNDSRNDFDVKAVGQVHIDSVIGKAVFRWWPLSDFGGLY